MLKKLFQKGNMNFGLLLITIILVLFGLITLLSASSPKSLTNYGNAYEYFVKQAKFTGIGIVVMLFISRLRLEIFNKKFWAVAIYGFCLLLALSVILYGREAGGAERWIYISGVGLQPSELIKVGLILFYAYYLSTSPERVKKANSFLGKIGYSIFLPLILLGIIIGIIFIFHNHLSVCILIALVVIVMMFVSGVKIREFALVGIIAAVVLLAGLQLRDAYYERKGIEPPSGFRSERIQVWLDPDSSLVGKGWQINQSYYAIGSGGLFGVGLGESNQKNSYLPEAQNDFIFAIYAEEMGFIWCIVLIVLYVIFLWFGFSISMKSNDKFKNLVGVGVTTLLGLQIFINIGVVIGFLPVTGMLLPFFSYGGTGQIINLACVGLLQNVAISNSNQKR